MRGFVWMISLLATATVWGGAKAERLSGSLEERAVVIRPDTKDLKWQQIPWLASLREAHETALRERRPLFVWILDDQPFDRC